MPKGIDCEEEQEEDRSCAEQPSKGYTRLPVIEAQPRRDFHDHRFTPSIAGRMRWLTKRYAQAVVELV